MTEQRATELLGKWDELIDPRDCDDLIFWLSSWIGEKEQDLTEADGVVAQKLLDLTEEKGSVAKAKVYLEVTPEFKHQSFLEANLRELRSARSNVKRRYEIITNKILNKYR